jgi:hypothetical protein
MLRPRDNPTQQIASMKKHFPQFRYKPNRRGGMDWEGNLSPTDESISYSIVIQHDPGRSPRLFVTQPTLPTEAPHRYRDGSLCLYWPKEWAWGAGQLLAQTLLPWAALWLYYFEIWQVTGEWLGPSSPHGQAVKNEEPPV